jgi:hypothetical protein
MMAVTDSAHAHSQQAPCSLHTQDYTHGFFFFFTAQHACRACDVVVELDEHIPGLNTPRADYQL